MRLLVVSWDAARPGWLDPDVVGLADALAREGADVEVVAVGGGEGRGRPAGVRITRAGEAPPVIPDGDHLSRVLAWNSRAHATALRVLWDRPADAIVAHGWQTTYAATNLRAAAGIPIVAVVPDTEVARGGDLAEPYSLLVHQIEWWLTYEARRIVTRDPAGRQDLVRTLRLPREKIDVIPAGQELPEQSAPLREPPRIVLLARPRGEGAGRVREIAARLRDAGVRCRVRRPGLVPPEALDVLVALDGDGEDDVRAARAHGRPVVVAERGPLRHLVQSSKSGLRIPVSDPARAVEVVAALASDPVRLRRLGAGARRHAERSSAWPAVAAAYLRAAERAVEDEATMRAEPPSSLRPVLVDTLNLDA